MIIMFKQKQKPGEAEIIAELVRRGLPPTSKYKLTRIHTACERLRDPTDFYCKEICKGAKPCTNQTWEVEVELAES